MKKFTYILLAAATLISASCSKSFLVEEPFLTESNSLTLSDYNGINAAVLGAYSPLADGSWYGADFVLTSEMRAENAAIPVNTDFQSGRYQVPFYMTYSSDNTVGLWGYAYFVISAVNNVLEQLETVGDEAYISGDITQQDIDNLKAECYFLRALAHFDLARVYAYSPAKSSKVNFTDCVPYIFKTDKTAKEEPARDSVKDVFTNIINDLKTAEGLMDPSYARAGVADKKAAATLPAIQGLLARVYLYNQEWQNAADYATKVISNGSFKLWTADEYASVWGNEVGGSEVIFEVYGKKSNAYDEYWEGPSHMTNPLGYADCAVAPALISIFDDPADVRGSQGIRGTDEGKALFCTDKDNASGGQFWTMKYYGKGEGDATSTPDVNNVIVLRLSEMYLIRAEALVNGASISGTSAQADLNAIRTNRGVAPLGSAGAADVALERRKELNFEGHYWFDLWRTSGGKVTYSDSRRGDNITEDSKFWALPIPKREYNVNRSLSHNPGFEN